MRKPFGSAGLHAGRSPNRQRFVHDRRADLSGQPRGAELTTSLPLPVLPGFFGPSEPLLFSAFKWVFGANFSFRNFDFNLNQTTFDQLLGPVLNATNADLNAFESRGGKLVMYHAGKIPWSTRRTRSTTSIAWY